MEERTTTPRSGRSRARTTGTPAQASDAALDIGTNDTAASSQPGLGIAGKVKERATAQLSTQKNRATDGLGTIAQAVRHTTDQLRRDQHDAVAQYVEKAADQLDRLSNRLREKDVNELLGDVQRFARQQPALFIGGSFAVALVAARFLKSSQQRDRAAGDRSQFGWDRTDATTSGDYGTSGAY